MKVNVRVRGEWILVPFKDENTVAWLGDECLARYRTLKRYDDDDGVCEIRRTRGGVLLFPKDHLRDVLDENDFVHVVLKSDITKRTHSMTIGDDVGISPTSLLNFGCADNHEIIYLDGDNLTTVDLVKLGKGNCKIKLSTTAWERVAKAREVVDRILKENKESSKRIWSAPIV